MNPKHLNDCKRNQMSPSTNINSSLILQNIQELHMKVPDEIMFFLESQKDQFIQELNMIQTMSNDQKSELINHNKEALEQSKLNLMNQIEQFYEEVEQRLEMQTQQAMESTEQERIQIEHKLINVINEIEDDLQKCNSSSNMTAVMEVLNMIVSNGQKNDYDSIKKEIDVSVLNYVRSLQEIQVDESVLGNINMDLQNYVQINNVDAQNYMRQFDINRQQDDSNYNNMNQQKQYDSNNQRQPYQKYQGDTIQAQNDSHFSNSQNYSPNNENIYKMPIPEEDSVVNLWQTDYFSSQSKYKYLHFFRDNSDLFYYLDLEQLSKDRSTQQWTEVKLDIQTKIPIYSRSIMTPQGDIYITGGVNPEQRSSFLKKMWKLNLTRNTLEQQSSMIYERGSHSLCYFQDGILAVGGSSNNDSGCWDKCEKYDIVSKKWMEISSLNKKTVGCCLTNFNNQFVYKFGGKADMFNQSNIIEKYDPRSNQWRLVAFNLHQSIDSQFKLPIYGTAIQINSNEIMVFGGQMINQVNTNSCSIFRTSGENSNQKDEGLIYASKAIPKAGCFWQNPIIQKGALFSVQNVPLDKVDYFGKKNIVLFNSKIWKEFVQI